MFHVTPYPTGRVLYGRRHTARRAPDQHEVCENRQTAPHSARVGRVCPLYLRKPLQRKTVPETIGDFTKELREQCPVQE